MDSAKIAYTINEAADAVGLGRTKLYDLIKHGRLDARKVGSRTLITGTSLQRLIDEAPAA